MKLAPDMTVILHDLNAKDLNETMAKIIGRAGDRIVVEIFDGRKVKVKRENLRVCEKVQLKVTDDAISKETEYKSVHQGIIVDMGIKCYNQFRYTLKRQKEVLSGWSTNSEKMVIDISKSTKKPGLHPFVLGLHLAFANEDDFQLTPDNIWLLIVQGVSQHINMHAEKFKSQLNIDFDGKKTIEIFRDSYGPDIGENPWEDCFPEFADKIKDIIGDNNVSMMMGEFTTTSPVDTIAYQIVLMDMVKQFLDYRVSTRCGVAKYHIKGTTSDWKAIFDKMQQFRKFELEEWIDKLQIFILEIIKAVAGKASYAWFRNFYKYDAGSGSDQITGEILCLFPYVKNFKGEFVWNKRTSVSSDQFPSGETDVPFIWNYLGNERKMHFKTKGILSLENRCICVDAVAHVDGES